KELTLPGHDIIVVGASNGGVEALCRIAAGLPADLPVALLVVVHVDAAGPLLLPGILNRWGPLPVSVPADGEPVQHGRIYRAPPDVQPLLNGELVRLSRAPRENRHRPAIDTLFRSAAHSRGPKVVGVVLTGSLDDGTCGLMMIKSRGGIAVVQDPADAL